MKHPANLDVPILAASCRRTSCKGRGRRLAWQCPMGAGGSKGSEEPEVWPPGWCAARQLSNHAHDIGPHQHRLSEPVTRRRGDIPDAPRLLARQTILEISALPPNDFCSIAGHDYAIPMDEWSFEAYHTAAAAAVQEDIKLNKIIYRLVPRRLSEDEFWRLYFSKVLHILESIKTHGVYPPPPPPPPPPPQDADAFVKGAPRKAAAPPEDDSCLVM